MTRDTEFPAESPPAVLSDDRQKAVDELGRLAGAALRSPAPEHGASAIMRRARTQRNVRTGAVVTSVLALVAIGILVVNRGKESQLPGEDTPDNTVIVTELHDVDGHEALPLARNALLTADDAGAPWTDDQVWGDTEFPEQFALTIAEMPECALLTSVGVIPPTTKSAGVYQHSDAIGIHNVLVFATPQDASHAMDVIDGPVFQKCWFNFWDRETAFDFSGATSTSEPWDAPTITAHGHRQIIIGQHMTTVNGASYGFLPEEFHVLAFIQVGRAITFVNPVYLDGSVVSPLLNVDKATTAAATALTNVFGP